jgi:hopanoid biosynthesis associated protein HpnK
LFWLTAAHCPEFVQTAVSLCVAERFRFTQVHFHTVFNRTVENFHEKFIFFPSSNGGMVSKVLSRFSPISLLEIIPSTRSKKEIRPHSGLTRGRHVIVRACYQQVRGCKICRAQMKYLILNADDFGMTRGVNQGIVRAHREGILTSATLMANGPAFDDAVEQIAANPKLGVGCHLVLVGGKCVARREDVASLADAQGNLPESLPKFVAKLSSGMIPTKQIEIEMRAQIEKIRAVGISLTHLDTHKHTHAHPRVMAALGKVAKELGIRRVRKPVENLHNSWQTMQADEKGFSMQIVAAGAVRAVAPRFFAIARKYGLTFPDHFLGLAVTGQVSAAALRRMVDTLDNGSTEIMLHPGICDADLVRSGTRLREHRETELAALLDPGVRGALDERGIRLISYRELN